MQLLAVQHGPAQVMVVDVTEVSEQQRARARARRARDCSIALLARLLAQNSRRWHIECRRSPAASITSAFAGVLPGALGGADGAALVRDGVLWSEHGGNSQDLVLVTQARDRTRKSEALLSHAPRARYPPPTPCAHPSISARKAARPSERR